MNLRGADPAQGNPEVRDILAEWTKIAEEGDLAFIAVAACASGGGQNRQDLFYNFGGANWFLAAQVRALDILNRNSPDELGSGANCSDFLDCLEVPTRDKGDFRHSRLLHGVRGSVWPFCVAFGRANVRHDSRVHLIAPLPSLIHCSHVPRLL
jgi:hypothetical protein